APGLCENALARVDQQNGEFGRRRAGDHVAGVLFVARSIGNDELALLARKIPVGDVDRDALLALGGKSVDEKREVNLLALRPVPFAVRLKSDKLVVEDLPRFVQQPPDQCRLTVVDAAAGDEAQKLLLLLRGEPGFGVG